jgi:hypothetical protein
MQEVEHMSLEHSPARQIGSPKDSIGSDLLLGAGPIALHIYGSDTPETRRNVYRNVLGLSFFKHGNTLAALKSTIFSEIAEMQRAAQEQRRQKKAAEARRIVKPRRRARRAEKQIVAE